MTNRYRKGSRKGELGDTDEAHLFIHLYEQDTTDDSTLRNRWNSLSNDEQEYILFQMGESRQDFEETFNQSSYEGSRKGSRRGGIYLDAYENYCDAHEDDDRYTTDLSMSEEEAKQNLVYIAEDENKSLDELVSEYKGDGLTAIQRFFREGSRKGSRKGAESFATSGFNKAVNGITGTLKSKPVMNTLKRTTGTKDQRNQAIIENNANKEAKASRQKKVNEIRKGSGPLCDMGNISGKGSRPDDLGQISSGVVSGIKRSIRLEGEYNQE